MLRISSPGASLKTDSHLTSRDSRIFHLPGGNLPRLLKVVLAISTLTLSGINATPVSAVEEAELFLAELRARGYIDTALDYIDTITQTDLVSDEFKSSVPFEKATLLADQALTVADPRQRDAILKESVTAFKAFAESQPKHEKAMDVRMQISNVLLALGKAKLKEADRPNVDKQALRTEARGLITEAYNEAVTAEKVIQTERIPLEKKRPTQGEAKERLDLLRISWLKSELLQAQLQYELSKTYEAASDGHKKQLAKARDEFKGLAEKHSGRMPGLYAGLRQTQCQVELGEHEAVLNVVAEFLELPDKPAQLRMMKLEGVRYAMEANIGLKKLDDALNKSGIVLSRSERGVPAGQGVMFFEAVAHKAKAAASADAGLKEEHQKQATEIAKELVKDASGEWQSRARELLVELGAPIEAPSEEAPETFAAAVNQANIAMQQRSLLKQNLKKAADDAKPEIQNKIDEQTDKAFQMFQSAIALADRDTPRARLAMIYKAICYLFWERKEHLRAAIVGDYLARQYPKDDNGKFGSWIAFNAWMVEYNKVRKDRSYEIEQMRRYANNIIARWPDASEAVSARFQLMAFAIQEGDVDGALGHLEAIPVDNPNRGQGELTVGQALWRKYARQRRLPPDDQPPQEELEKMLTTAQKVLSDGLKRMEGSGKVDANLIGAAYSLAQLYAGTNQPVEAITLYEHELYGPLTLVQADAPVAREGDYGLRTYRLALRTYISALPSFQGDAAKQSEMVTKAMQMVEALEKAVEAPDQADAGGGTAAERLTRIYIEMGTELEDQIKALVTKGDLQGKDALSKAFETFLDKIRSRETGNTYSSLIWIAETFYGLGKSNTDESGQPNAAAQGYFRRAAETYQKILDRAAADPQFLKNPRQRTTIEMRLARSYRSLGDIEKALDKLETVLKRKTTNLTVQVEAAEVLFDAGTMQCENYQKAFFGVRPDKKGKNIIWGWRRLGDITRQHEKFEPFYLKSVLFGIKCRMEVALCQQNAKPDQKSKLLAAAQGTLISIFREKPQLGGEELHAEFDRIARKLQELLGQDELGLKAYAKPTQPGLEDETESEEETG